MNDDISVGVRLLRLNRGEKRYALVTPTLGALATALFEADPEKRICVVAINGSDKLFAAGADLDELAASSSNDELGNSRFQA